MPSMHQRTFFGVMITLVGAAFAAACLAAGPAVEAGLVAVASPDLDQLFLRPAVNLAGYHKVLIDPARISFRSDWNKSQQDILGKTRRLSADEVQVVADDAASSMQSALTQAFTTRGYEIAAAPGEGVLRLSPSVVELFVNAPNARPSGEYVTFTQRDDGEATLVLEVRDAVTGTLLGRVVDHRFANKQYQQPTRTTTVATNFWFENTFRAWATTCAKEFEATNAQRVGLQTPH